MGRDGRKVQTLPHHVAIEKSWSDDAIAYDALVKSWPRVEELAVQVGQGDGQLFQT